MQKGSSQIVCKQTSILEEMKRRLQDGYYSYKLPKTTELAEEFKVNVKTMNKVMLRLVRLQLVDRKPRGGTTVRRNGEQAPGPVIEIIYEGSHNMEIHPYWMAVWQGLMGSFASQRMTIKLNRLSMQSDKTFDLEHLRLDNVSARLVIGIHDKRFFEMLKQDKTPYLSVGDAVKDIRIPQIQISFRNAVERTVDWLFKHEFEDIAFIGRVYSYSDSGDLEKYNAWRDAMIRHRSISDNLFEHAYLQENAAYQATLKILERKVPQIMIVASDTQIPEVYRAMQLKRVSCPVIGCDGISLACDSEHRRFMPIQAPLFASGQRAAETIIHAIDEGRKPKSIQFEAKFIQRELAKLVPRKRRKQ